MEDKQEIKIGRYQIAYILEEVPQPKGLVVMVHGMGEHCWRYEHVANVFKGQGLNVLRFDLPGHGLSSGKRGHITAYKDVLAPIHYFLNHMNPELPKFLFGHSMGGNIVLGYLLFKQPKLAGAIIASPWVALAFKPGFLKTVLAKIANRIFPSLVKKNYLEVDSLSRDYDVVNSYEEDDLVHDWISPRLFVEMSKVATLIQLRCKEIKNPCMLYHGKEDAITAHWATKLISEKMEQAQFVSYDSGYHEMHNEPNKEEVFDNIRAFVDQRLAALP